MFLPACVHEVYSRRHFLLASSLATAMGQLPAWARMGERPGYNPFTLGVASGDPEPDNVLLWTRLAPAAPGLPTTLPAQSVRWELAHDSRFLHMERSGQAMALPEQGHSLHVQVDGLAPDRWYYYRFMLGDAVSTTGRCRTAPARDSLPKRLRLAYASCQRWEHGYYAAWAHMLKDPPDLVLFLGDYIYESASPGLSLGMARSHNLRTAQSLQDYRDRYALYKSDAHLQAAHAACNWAVIWDDHEVENDYAGQQGMGNAQRFAARRAAATQAFYENMPLRADTLAAGLSGPRLYRSLRWGRLAHLHLLDGRQYRDLQACRTTGAPNAGSVRPGDCQALHAASRSFLGWDQERWLYRQLAQDAGTDSRSSEQNMRWSVMAQTTLLSARRYPSGVQASDSWDGYPAARQRLMQQLSGAAGKAPRNSVVLGGDIHQNYVCALPARADLPPAPDNPVVASEFCTTSISSRSGTTQAKVDAVRAHNPQVLFARCEERGYGWADITPERWDCELRTVLNPLLANSPVLTQARFSVLDRRPGPVEG
ncbi:alkaline phosphatase D family protein [Comamonas composti]|uniref:alkaline phosphatase D family protein n=1 Tax=Comamonas composti TaxID=408558 RepID=UPI0005559E79